MEVAWLPVKVAHVMLGHPCHPSSEIIHRTSTLLKADTIGAGQAGSTSMVEFNKIDLGKVVVVEADELQPIEPGTIPHLDNLRS